jgi:alcohol dehydrogenase class IV
VIAHFDFATAGQIVFGNGRRAEAVAAVRALGRTPLLVTGAHPERAAWFGGAETLSAAGEPTIDDARSGASLARQSGCDVIVAIGGGSAIDLAKAVAALAANSGDVLDYLEVVGRGRPFESDPLPVVAVPTTAGTGSEVTRNAVLGSPEHGVKASLRHVKLLPRVAVVDPELAAGLSRDLTAWTGLDALTQLIEPAVSRRANPLTSALCREAIPRAVGALHALAASLDNAEARAEMAFASLCGGIALANAGLGAVHGFAAPIGGMFGAPHGAVCARLLPLVIEANQRGLEWLDDARDLVAAFSVPGLAHWGVRVADIPVLVERAKNASSMKANPVALEDSQLREILSRAL